MKTTHIEEKYRLLIRCKSIEKIYTHCLECSFSVYRVVQYHNIQQYGCHERDPYNTHIVHVTLHCAAEWTPSSLQPALLRSWPGPGGSRCTAGPVSGPLLTGEQTEPMTAFNAELKVMQGRLKEALFQFNLIENDIVFHQLLVSEICGTVLCRPLRPYSDCKLLIADQSGYPLPDWSM